jgi:hypothetical protein
MSDVKFHALSPRLEPSGEEFSGAASMPVITLLVVIELTASLLVLCFYLN